MKELAAPPRVHPAATRDLVSFAFVNIVVVSLVLVTVFSAPWKQTGLFRLGQQFVSPEAGDDSWLVMDSALDAFRAHTGETIYAAVFFRGRQKFQYPPTSLFPLALLRSPTVAAALDRAGLSDRDVLFALSWLAVLATAWLTMRIFESARGPAEGAAGNDPPRREQRIVEVSILALALSFYPLRQGFALGQIQVWIDALVAASLLLWIRGRKGATGALLGLCCLIKPQFALLLLWGVLRRNWTFVRGFASVVLAGLAVSIPVFGLANHVDYLRVLSFISHRGEAFYPNQSFNGLLNRLLFNGVSGRWLPNDFAPYRPWVYAGTLASSLVLLVLALRFRRTASATGDTADLAAMIVVCTLASPIAWEHHYGILLPIYAFVLAVLLRETTAGMAAFVGLGTSFVLASNFLAFTNRWSAVPVLNIAQSYLLAAALILLGYLLAIRRREPEIGYG